jgi:PAS domain S-box-containing protein
VEDGKKTKIQLISEGKVKHVECEQTYQVIAESTHELVAANRQLKHNLAERVKELRCLYGMAAIDENSEITLNELYQEVANLLPSSWQYPEVCSARITIEDREFRTANYRHTGWKLCSDIKVSGVKAGTVEVNYLKKRPELDEGPFSREERRLIDAVAERVGRITERKKAEELLKLRTKEQEVLLSSIPAFVYFKDTKSKLITANKAFAEMVNTPIDHLPGKDAYDLFPKEQAQKFHIDDQKVMQSGEAIMNIVEQFTDAEGKTRWASSSKVPYFGENGKVAGMVGLTIDITERKRAEEELQEKNEQLKAQHEELVEKSIELELVNQAKSEFLASMSHELRTPLNAVIGFSELMLNGIPGEINDEQRGCLNDILDSGRLLLSLINDILDLSKVEAGKIELKPQNLDIAAIVSGVVQIMKPVLDKNRQEIEVSVIQGLPKVRGDKNRLEQILLNLLSNASKFTDQGGSVRIHVGRKDDYCQVAVIDTGIGIKKEDQEHVFEAFVQGETLSDRKKEGTGLGLTLTKRFVEAIGGRIWMESEYGKGSTFIFTIPLAGEPLETSLGDKQSSYS